MTLRCGDHVHHTPSGEDWVVAFVEGNDLAMCGWPPGIARTSDCVMIKACSDEEHMELLRQIANMPDIDIRKSKALAEIERMAHAVNGDEPKR